MTTLYHGSYTAIQQPIAARGLQAMSDRYIVDEILEEQSNI